MIQRAVVTGAGGFIGQALVSRLIREGTQVIAIGRREMTFGCQCEVVDVREPGAINRFLTAGSVVFHMAGHTSVAGSVHDPHLDFESNVSATLEILQSVREANASLILPSSPAVFEPGQDLPLNENARKRPSSPYGASKLACEGYAQAFHGCYCVDVKIARIFNVYGPTMRRFAIYDFYRKLRQNPNHLEILGGGDQIRDYLYMDDAIEGLLAIACHGAPGEDYNLAFGEPIRTIDLARAVASAMGHRATEIRALGDSFPGDVAKWYADIAKVKALGFKPAITLLDGLARTVSSFDAVHTSDDHANEVKA